MNSQNAVGVERLSIVVKNARVRLGVRGIGSGAARRIQKKTTTTITVRVLALVQTPLLVLTLADLLLQVEILVARSAGLNEEIGR